MTTLWCVCVCSIVVWVSYSENNCESWFFPSTMWVLWLELRFLVSAEANFHSISYNPLYSYHIAYNIISPFISCFVYLNFLCLVFFLNPLTITKVLPNFVFLNNSLVWTFSYFPSPSFISILVFVISLFLQTYWLFFFRFLEVKFRILIWNLSFLI